jgi:hypothetical protein
LHLEVHASLDANETLGKRKTAPASEAGEVPASTAEGEGGGGKSGAAAAAEAVAATSTKAETRRTEGCGYEEQKAQAREDPGYY